jgi:hypothetical protein
VALLLACLLASSAKADFGFQRVSFEATEEDGSPTEQAGAHPFALTASVFFNTIGPAEQQTPDGHLRDLRIGLPAGLIGTPALIPHCRHADFLTDRCSPGAAIGTVQILARFSSEEGSLPALIQAPVYNLDPLAGSGAEFGIYATFFESTSRLNIKLGISSETPNLFFASLTDTPQKIPILAYRLVLWGSPGDPAHDPYRGACGRSYLVGAETFEPLSAGSCSLEEDPRDPLLSISASCLASTAHFQATSWSGDSSRAALEVPPAHGCTGLAFTPQLAVTGTSTNANSPSGLDLRFEQRNEGLLTSDKLAGPQLSGADFKLPLGMTLNPSFVSGLGYCTPEQLSKETVEASAAEGCPQSSEVGTAEARTPLFTDAVEGSIYLAEPNDPATKTPGSENPFDARFALYFILKAPERGILIVQPILISADRETGQLDAALTEIPQLPLERLALRFDSSTVEPLATPPTCGAHSFSSSLLASSGIPLAIETPFFSITDNCPTTFEPSLGYQLSSSAAGSSAELTLQLSDTSHEPSPAAIALTLPAGLSAALGAVPTCAEAPALSATCPPNSRLGHLRIAIGAGPEPLSVPPDAGPGADVFLAGPYRGAPFSLLTKLPAAAGPFDLGTALLRAPIFIDPRTAQATIKLEDLPQILAGIPLRYREIRLSLDRPGLLRNPTSCGPTQILGSALASNGELAKLRQPFQVADCGALPFRPRLALSLSGNLARNGHPSLRAALRADPGEAALASATFTLPPGELLDLHHVRALCPRDLTPEQCPAASRLGPARLWSPLADTPLEGPIYLREPNHGLPDLLANLQGGGVHIVLHGGTATVGGRMQLRLDALPDIPLSRAVISIAGGRDGIFVNSRDLCATYAHAAAALSAHSGKRLLRHPRLRIRCLTHKRRWG